MITQRELNSFIKNVFTEKEIDVLNTYFPYVMLKVYVSTYC